MSTATITAAPCGNPTKTRARFGLWNGLVVGDNGFKHRGRHAAVLGEDGQPIAIVGSAEDPVSVADARMFAHLWNAAIDARTTVDALN